MAQAFGDRDKDLGAPLDALRSKALCYAASHIWAAHGGGTVPASSWCEAAELHVSAADYETHAHRLVAPTRHHALEAIRCPVTS